MKSEDITGDLDLLGDWLDAKGYTEEAGLCTRAMDEINRLRDKTLEEAAKAAEGFPKNREWVPGSLYDTLRREVAQDIRRLK